MGPKSLTPSHIPPFPFLISTLPPSDLPFARDQNGSRRSRYVHSRSEMSCERIFLAACRQHPAVPRVDTFLRRISSSTLSDDEPICDDAHKGSLCVAVISGRRCIIRHRVTCSSNDLPRRRSSLLHAFLSLAPSSSKSASTWEHCFSSCFCFDYMRYLNFFPTAFPSFS